MAQSPLTLTADTQFLVKNQTLNLEMIGPPDARVDLKMSLAPNQFESVFGTIFLDLATLTNVRSGVIDATGRFSVALKVPADPALVNRVFYFQAVSRLGTLRSASNALPIRIDPTSLPVARHPASLAVLPDGSRAYVLHESDASVSVLDPAHDTVVRDMPVSAIPTDLERSPHIAIDPEGRYAFVVNPGARQVTVIHTATDSIAAQIPVPLSCRAVAFQFDGVSNRVFVSSERDHGILVFTEVSPGHFVQTAVLPLQGGGPAVLALLADGHLLVGQQTTLELEVVDPDDLDGDPLLQRVPMGSRPLSISVLGSRVFVSTFTPSTLIGPDGVNEVLEFDPSSWTVVSRSFGNLATNYFGTAVSQDRLLVTGSSSGSLLIADPADLSTASVVDLLPGGSAPAEPMDVALVPPLGGGTPDRAYVIDRFRETVFPVHVDAGPPFSIDPEIPLAHSGAPVDPLTDVSQQERGEYFFSNVLFFNGGPERPNPVACTTCHLSLFSDSITNSRNRNAQGLFALPSTATYAWDGHVTFLVSFSQIGFDTHGKVGGFMDPQRGEDLHQFLESLTRIPTSPFKEADGSISAAARNGEVLFQGAAGCAICHPAPLFLPAPTDPRDVPEGVGTGLAPVNIPSLIGVWATAPYLHDGSVPTLLELLTGNVDDLHGTTSGLDAQQLSDLVEYLKTL